ncbi:TlpA family protein disulfide reductase [Hoyosella sp. G463]|uniref:TlpA family protein disulfide reductase n=1 Tax=Lolliginicoccus lacisalsi TaxID=2742202 RepID=A0A927PMX4_9ACTN|nr:TlpA disulfide reductase family protein [Lolliginicoccus lacisalsi]MBD8507247.1 TlpA family protein disulfide reductase [Lolliginicoccus lacisalsi]
MSSGARGSLAALAIVLALIVAIWPRGDDDATAPGTLPGRGAQSEQGDGRPPVANEALAGDRARASLDPCPAVSGATGASWAADHPLRGLELGCLADGATVDLEAALAGKPAVLNIWAYWCGPCAEELPAMQEYARGVAGDITVLTVHRDPNEANALARLAQYGVTIPGVQDAKGRIPAQLGAPPVLPVTIVLDAGGSVAGILAEPFTTPGQIQEAVTAALQGAPR